MAGQDLSWLNALINADAMRPDMPPMLSTPSETAPLRGMSSGVMPLIDPPTANAHLASQEFPRAPNLMHLPPRQPSPSLMDQVSGLFGSGSLDRLEAPDASRPVSQSFPLSNDPANSSGGTPAVDELGRIAGEPRDSSELKSLPGAYLGTIDTIGKQLGKWDEMISPKLYRPGLLDRLFGQNAAAAEEKPPEKSPLEAFIDSQGGPIKGDEKVAPPKSKGRGGPGLTPAAPVAPSAPSSYDLGSYEAPGLAPHRAVGQAPDFHNVMDELDQTRPVDEKQDTPRWQAALLGLAQGMAQAPRGATLGQMLLGAGTGALGGSMDYDREGRQIRRGNQRAQSEFHRQMAESLLSQDQAQQNWRDKADTTTFSNEMADYEREAQIRRDMEPKIDVTSAGVVRQGVDPTTGKRSLAIDTSMGDARDARADARQYAHEDRQFAQQRQLQNERLAAKRTAVDTGDPVLSNLGIGKGKRTPETVSREFGVALARNPGLVAQVFGPQAATMGQEVNNLVGKDSSFHSMAGYMKGKVGESQANTLAQSAVANYYADKILRDPEAQKTALRIMGAQ